MTIVLTWLKVAGSVSIKKIKLTPVALLMFPWQRRPRQKEVCGTTPVLTLIILRGQILIRKQRTEVSRITVLPDAWDLSLLTYVLTLWYFSAQLPISVHLPRPRTELLRSSPFYQTISLLNSIPSTIKRSWSSVKSHIFSSALSSWLLPASFFCFSLRILGFTPRLLCHALFCPLFTPTPFLYSSLSLQERVCVSSPLALALWGLLGVLINQ